MQGMEPSSMELIFAPVFSRDWWCQVIYNRKGKGGRAWRDFRKKELALLIKKKEKTHLTL